MKILALTVYLLAAFYTGCIFDAIDHRVGICPDCPFKFAAYAAIGLLWPIYLPMTAYYLQHHAGRWDCAK